MRVRVSFEATIKGVYSWDIEPGQRYNPNGGDQVVKQMLLSRIDKAPPQGGALAQLDVEVERAYTLDIMA